MTLVGGVLAMSLVPSPAYAAPSNDEQSGAVVVPGVPFSDTRDTAGADWGERDTGCTSGGGFTVTTVWYKFRPATDGLYRFDTLGSNYDTTLALVVAAEDEQDSQSVIACNNDEGGGTLQSVLTHQLTAGTLYYIEVGNRTPLSGSTNLVFNVDFASPFDAQISLATEGTIGAEPGSATLPTRITCSDAGEASIFGTLRQRQGRTLVEGTTDFTIPCGPTTRTFSMDFSGGSRAYVPGKATVNLTVFTSHANGFVEQQISRKIRLR